MQVYELIVTCQVLKTHHHSQDNEIIGNFINYALHKDEELKKFHTERKYKHYVFQSLYPIEEDGFYKKGHIYVFRLRTMHNHLAEKLRDLLKQRNDDLFVLAIELTSLAENHIFELKTITPVIVTVDSAPWLRNDGIFLLQERLHINAVKKYIQLTNEERTFRPFIQRIELLNDIPVGLEYKNIKLLGHKMRIYVNEDQDSQLLARLVVGAGLGEKNSALGAGYLTYY